MKKMGLGRGLDALLPEDDAAQAGDIRAIAITEIDRNPDQPRRTFDADALQQLADSIREAGVLQPLLVVERDGRFRIVAGERRFRAARLAGLDTVPCLVRDLSETEQMEIALIENLQREDLNPLEEAQAIRALMDECSYTQEKAAKRLGKSRPAVANSLRLLTLPASVQAMLRDGRLSAGHARVLAGIDDEKRQLALAEQTVADGLSVRALERLAAQPVLPAHQPAAPASLPLELKDMQERMRSAFGVRATLQGNGQKGKVVLPYRNPDELNAIFQALEKIEHH